MKAATETLVHRRHGGDRLEEEQRREETRRELARQSRAQTGGSKSRRPPRPRSTQSVGPTAAQKCQAAQPQTVRSADAAPRRPADFVSARQDRPAAGGDRDRSRPVCSLPTRRYLTARCFSAAQFRKMNRSSGNAAQTETHRHPAFKQKARSTYLLRIPVSKRSL